MEFHRKVAIVTGGAQGIGQAYCLKLLKAGMKVCCCDIKETPALDFINTLSTANNYKDNFVFHKCDVASVNEFKGAFEKTLQMFGRIDLVVNNAGIFNEHDWKKTIEVNFIGVINGIQLAFQFMDIHNGGTGGHVVNTASNLGFEPFPLGPIYSGCKHGVIGLTKSYGSDFHYEKTGVKVSAICPGPVDTELFHNSSKMSLDEEVARQHNAMVKTVKAGEIAEALIQLLKDGKNGGCLRVDAGGLRYV